MAENWLDASGAIIETIAATYDTSGRLATIGDSATNFASGSNLAFTYDTNGQIATVTDQVGSGFGFGESVVLANTFDAVGRRATLSATINGQADFTDTYGYNSAGLVSRVEQSGATGGAAVAPERVDLTYDPLGQLQTITRYADLAGTVPVVATVEGYDTLGRVTSVTDSHAGTVLASYTTTYDAASRAASDTSPEGTTHYGYDADGQLVSAGPGETHTYDATGNRTNPGYLTGPGDLVLSDGKYNYQYDGEGNRTRRTDIATGTVDVYTWDYRDRLTSVVTTDKNGGAIQTVTYSYDAFNRLVSEQVQANNTVTGSRFVYDGQNLILAFNSGGFQEEGGFGTLSNRYLQGPAVDQVLADDQVSPASPAGRVLWTLGDRLGSIHDVVDNTGAVVDHRAYDAFGVLTAETNPATAERFGYTGQFTDAATGLQDDRARFYDPTLGRFLSKDPTGFAAGDFNLTRYVGNDPTDATDPTGLLETVEVSTTLSIGSAAEVESAIAAAAGRVILAELEGVIFFQGIRQVGAYAILSTLSLGTLTSLVFQILPPEVLNPPSPLPQPLQGLELLNAQRAYVLFTVEPELEALPQQYRLKPGVSFEDLLDGKLNPCDAFGLPPNTYVNFPMIVSREDGKGDDLLSYGAIGLISQQPRNGTDTNGSSTDLVRRYGYSNDAAGHVVGNQLGGSGATGSGNLFPQNPTTNSGVFATQENRIAAAIDRPGGQDVCVLIALLYRQNSDYPHRPVAIAYATWGGYDSAVGFRNEPPFSPRTPSYPLPPYMP